MNTALIISAIVAIGSFGFCREAWEYRAKKRKERNYTEYKQNAKRNA